MQKTKIYTPFKFSASIISKAHQELLKSHNHKNGYAGLRVELENETWDFDTVEEFYAALDKADGYDFDDILGGDGRLIVSFHGPILRQTRVVVRSNDRKVIDSVYEILEKDLDRNKMLITPEPVKIFIGHGKDDQWKLLKEHLHEKHGYEVTAYEIGPRAGKSVKEILQDLQSNSSFAILIMTGEDLHNDGTVHARENVIHEIGLFQGHLGFEKAIILKEEGVNEFSNILGINQIRFSKGRISGTYGDIIAVLKREFEAV